jgi:hypothetical protein
MSIAGAAFSIAAKCAMSFSGGVGFGSFNGVTMTFMHGQAMRNVAAVEWW